MPSMEKMGGFDIKAQEEMIQICTKLTNYLHDKKIDNLILVDRRARPAYVGVQKVWQKQYPGEELPKIYFVNPYGFWDKSIISMEQIERNKASVLRECSDNIGDIEGFENWNQEKIDEDFRNKYPELIKEKDKRVLVFDCCIHQGVSMEAIKDSLERIGFCQIFLGVGTNSENRSKLVPDLICINRLLHEGCSPFGQEVIVDKILMSTCSKRTGDPQRIEASTKTRRDLRQIFD